MDIDCCITNDEHEKLANMQMTLPFSNILTATHDFKYMGMCIDEVQKKIKQEEKKIQEDSSFFFSYSFLVYYTYYYWLYCTFIALLFLLRILSQMLLLVCSST